MSIADYSPEPLRAEVDAADEHSSWALEVWPACTPPTVADASPLCVTTGDAHELCQFSCPLPVVWETGNGTACMHRLPISVPDDGKNSAPIKLAVRLRLYTFSGIQVTDETREIEMSTYADNRAGFFHFAEVQWVVIDQVAKVLGASGMPECGQAPWLTE